MLDLLNETDPVFEQQHGAAPTPEFSRSFVAMSYRCPERIFRRILRILTPIFLRFSRHTGTTVHQHIGEQIGWSGPYQVRKRTHLFRINYNQIDSNTQPLIFGKVVGWSASLLAPC